MATHEKAMAEIERRHEEAMAADERGHEKVMAARKKSMADLKDLKELIRRTSGPSAPAAAQGGAVVG